MSRLLVYVSGPYTADTPEEVEANVKLAVEAAQELMRMGCAVICPHSMTWGWEDAPGLSYDDFLASDLAIVARCDAICMVGSWYNSTGALKELRAAVRQEGMVIFGGVEEARGFLVERKCDETDKEKDP